MKRLSNEEMSKLEEVIALEIDKALSPHSDNQREFVKDLTIVQEFIAKQILAIKADKYYQESSPDCQTINPCK